MEMAATAISEDISIEAIIGNVFAMTRFLGVASDISA
jgi:hypothetical protein